MLLYDFQGALTWFYKYKMQINQFFKPTEKVVFHNPNKYERYAWFEWSVRISNHARCTAAWMHYNKRKKSQTPSQDRRLSRWDLTATHTAMGCTPSFSHPSDDGSFLSPSASPHLLSVTLSLRIIGDFGRCIKRILKSRRKIRWMRNDSCTPAYGLTWDVEGVEMINGGALSMSMCSPAMNFWAGSCSKPIAVTRVERVLGGINIHRPVRGSVVHSLTWNVSNS